MDTTSTAQFDPIADLLDVLDLDEVGTRRIDVSGARATDTSTARVFRGRSQPTPQRRAFGGQVLAQALMAAGRTIEDVATRVPHSMHAYFLRPGDSAAPIQFTVENMRDGRSFSARRVHAMQGDKILLSLISSFQDRADGLDHQLEMPDVPSPDEFPSLQERFSGATDPRGNDLANRMPIDLRHVDGEIWTGPAQSRHASHRVWMRPRASLGDELLVHAAVLAYSSDYSVLESILRRHGVSWSDPRLRPASLDHAMWFHRPPRFDDWVLYSLASPSAASGRGFGIGRMFTRDGVLIASVGQEGMVRLKD